MTYTIRDDNQVLDTNIVRMLIKIRRIVLYMPIRHIKIGGNEDQDHIFQGFETKTKRYSVFGLYNRNLSDSANRNFEEVLNNSTNWDQFGTRRSKRWDDLVSEEVCYLRLGYYAYLQLVASRIYIRDVIIKRWIEYSVPAYLKHDGHAVYELIKSFDLQLKDPDRDSIVIGNLRAVAKEVFVPMRCLYCNISLHQFDLDHFVPWSKYPNNSFWNLFPACKGCNGSKSDRVLVLEDRLEE